MSASASADSSCGPNKRRKQMDEEGKEEPVATREGDDSICGATGTGASVGAGGAAAVAVAEVAAAGAPVPGPAPARAAARAVPVYDGDALALEVLADPWFYFGAAMANTAKEARHNTLIGNPTIRQVRETYPKRRGDNSLRQLARLIGADFRQIEQYFAAAAAGAHGLSPAHAAAGVVPVYDGDALALEVLADPWFHYNETYANLAEEARRNTLKPDETIRQVREKYSERGGSNSLDWLSDAIRTRVVRIKQYFEAVELSVEEWLGDEGFVGLGDLDAVIKLYRSRRIAGGTPATRAAFAESKEGDRELPLCFVLGPSGSGKTFFAFEHLREFGKTKWRLGSVALYAQTGRFVADRETARRVGAVDFESPEAPMQLGLYVRKLLDQHIQTHHRWWKARLLDMHVCFIFGEAGNTALRGFFDDPVRVRALVSWLEAAGIAASISVAVVGTGLAATAFDSTKDAFVFRMKPWAKEDLKELLKNLARRCGEDDYLSLEPYVKRAEDVARAVYALPLLQALSTNGRSAYFLGRSLAQLKRRTPSLNALGWLEHMTSALPTIVDEVVSDYVAASSISQVPPEYHRRVAAWLFGALSRLEIGKTDPPVLEGLPLEQRKCAGLLLQLNVQKEGSRLTLLPGQRLSATVTPATTIVLFHMAGFLTGILSGWRGEEEVAALYAAQRGVIERWREHTKEVHDLQKTFVPDHHNMTLEEFDRILATERRIDRYYFDLSELSQSFSARLEELRIYRLQRQVQSPKGAAVFIPAVPKHAIMVNAERAFFANVIAHRMLLQAKHTSTPKDALKVDLLDEMRKCGLLKDGGRDRALRGLLLLWNDKLEPRARTDESAFKSGSAPIDLSSLQGSKCFPANMIQSREAQEFVLYHKINTEEVVEKLGDTKLPVLPERLDVTFVLCTNATKIELDVTPPAPKSGDGKPNEGASSPRTRAGTPSDGTHIEDDGTMSGHPQGPDSHAKDPRSKTEQLREVVVSVTEQSLGHDLDVDVDRLADDGEREAWERFCGAVVDGVKVQFLFTRAA